jgi:hypothetical protein
MARYVHRITASGPINDTMPAITSERRLTGVAIHASAAPTTSEDLTVTLNSIGGAAYDVVLYKVDLSASSATDLLWTDANLPLMLGDSIVVQFANSDAVTVGVTLIME